MIYELRVYTANPGKMEALHSRFRDHTRRFFEKHGMTSVGYWVQTEPEDGTDNLIYVLAHPSREAAATAWAAFHADPEWLAVRAASMPDGVSLTAKVTSQFMEPTDYSALQ